MCGYEAFSQNDIYQLETFYYYVKQFTNGTERCLEIAAGSLRVTENILCKLYDEIDVNDVSDQLSKKWSLIQNDREKRRGGKIGRKYVCDMMSIPFDDRKYNLIIGSWAFENLTDREFLDFLNNCRGSLLLCRQDPGMIIFKESIHEGDDNFQDYDKKR